MLQKGEKGYNGIGNTRHGLSHHPLYRIWTYMKSRCYNLNDTAYYDYGGRGIAICEEWKDNPEAFVLWGIDNGWTKGLNIDRIDNDGSYELSNCRFVTTAINNINQRLRKDNSSGYKGVGFHKAGKKRKSGWEARVQFNGKRKTIGSFKTAKEAAMARNKYITNASLPHKLCLVSDGGA